MEVKKKTAVERTPTKKLVRIFEKDGVKVEVFENNIGLISLAELNDLAESSRGQEALKKRILLIDFKTLQKVPENQDYSFQNFLNLGVHRLEGYLRDYGIDVDVVRYGELVDDPEALARLVESHDIIGVSNLSSQVEDVYKVCSGIKEKYGDRKLTIGGSEHYLGSDGILTDQENTGIDVCCLGQGELPLLALGLGQPVERVGSLVYRSEAKSDRITIVQNQRFQRLIDLTPAGDAEEMNVLNTRVATPFSAKEIGGRVPFNEFNGLEGFEFEANFATQTGSGCLYGCDFCPNKKFFGAKFEINLGAAKEEVLNFKKQNPDLKEVFLTFTDAMINPSEEHLQSVIDFMAKVNQEPGPKIYWFAYLSAPRLKAGETIDAWRSKWDKYLEKMAAAGCIMAAVGVEEIIHDRNLVHHKGQDVDTASEFIDLTGKYMLTRSLLIMGAPEHFYIDRDKTLKGKEYLDEKYGESDRDLIKGEILDYMKRHPQALYRMNPWTLVYGTDNFDKYKECLSEDVTSPSKLKLLDHLHSLIDPEKMYDYLGRQLGISIPPERHWVKQESDWFVLMEEIMEEYLNSPEYFAYINGLKGRSVNGSPDLLYKVAIKFRENALTQIAQNRKGKAM